MSSTKAFKSFRPCCFRTLSNIFTEYMTTGVRPVQNYKICSTAECSREFKLYSSTYSIKEKCFLFVYNGWWYMFDFQASTITSFYPIMEVYSKDPETFIDNLVKEELLSEPGRLLILGQINQQQYVQQVLTASLKKETITEDFNMVKMCRVFWETNQKDMVVQQLKKLALSILDGELSGGTKVVA